MAYVSFVPTVTGLAPRSPARKTETPRPRKKAFARFLAALDLAGQHSAERDMARYVMSNGGKFTDETEREIERRFLARPRW